MLDLQANAAIGTKYRVLTILGRGGMGTVVRALHTRLDQIVAIKILKPELVADRAQVVRFEREARAAARLTSPHSIRIFDVNETADGVPYIVMELLEGNDLSEEAKRHEGPLPLTSLVDWSVQVCSALGEAHALEIVHRDVKPSNIFLCRDGADRIAKIVDFGISKAQAVKDEVTLADQMIGTPRYMSPEQARGAKTIDGRSDLWSLGVMLYRLLGGRFPFQAESASALAIAIFAEPAVFIASLRPDLPAPLGEAIMRALHKDPADRFPDVQAFANAIFPFGSGRKPLPPVRGSRPSLSTSERATAMVVESTSEGAAIPKASPAPQEKQSDVGVPTAALAVDAATAVLGSAGLTCAVGDASVSSQTLPASVAPFTGHRSRRWTVLIATGVVGSISAAIVGLARAPRAARPDERAPAASETARPAESPPLTASWSGAPSGSVGSPAATLPPPGSALARPPAPSAAPRASPARPRGGVRSPSPSTAPPQEDPLHL